MARFSSYFCLRTALRIALEGEPFIDTVYDVECERDALHAVDNHKIDVILLDLKLKESSGLDLYKKIKNEPANPVPLLSQAWRATR